MKRLKEMQSFAELQRKAAKNQIKTYSRKGWDKVHAELMINQAINEIIIWDWIIGSLKRGK